MARGLCRSCRRQRAGGELCAECQGCELAAEEKHCREDHEAIGRQRGCRICTRMALPESLRAAVKRRAPKSVQLLAQINATLAHHEANVARLRRLQRKLARRLTRLDLDWLVSNAGRGLK